MRFAGLPGVCDPRLFVGNRSAVRESFRGSTNGSWAACGRSDQRFGNRSAVRASGSWAACGRGGSGVAVPRFEQAASSSVW